MTTTNSPPEPPDLSTMHIDKPATPNNTSIDMKQSFKNTLLSHNQIHHLQSTCHTTHSHIDFSDETTNDYQPDTFIPLTSTDKTRLYSPWKSSVIVKVFGRKVGHQTLRTKLRSLWQPIENLPLIDLGLDFFLIKFQKEENMNNHEGLWFIFNHFLSMRKWEP